GGADVYYQFDAKLICRGNKVMMILRYYGNNECALFVSEPHVHDRVLSLTPLTMPYTKQRIIDLYKKYIACQTGDTETSVAHRDMAICSDHFMKTIAKKHGLTLEQ